MWWKLRRPELLQISIAKLWARTVTNSARELASNHTSTKLTTVCRITKKLVGHLDNSGYPLATVDIQLTLTVPADARGPVP